jgi:hypothetical protein
MLIVQALTRLLHLYDKSELPEISSDLLRDQIPVVLFQALVRCLRSQASDGSWSKSTEVTAYAVLTLANLASLPFIDAIADTVHQTIELGRQYLEIHRDDREAEHIWIEKVTYGSKSLYKAYTLAALHVTAPTHQFSDKVKVLTSIPWENVFKFAKFYSMLPIYAATPEWLIRASLIEGYLFLPRLKQMRHTLFPRDNMAEDKYFEYIPFTWTGANNRAGALMNANFLFDMMVVSFLGYQVDEYMETVVGGRGFEHRLPEVLAVIDEIFDKLDTCSGINESDGFARLKACEKSLLANSFLGDDAGLPSSAEDTHLTSLTNFNQPQNKPRSDSLLDESVPDFLPEQQLSIITHNASLEQATLTPPISPIEDDKLDAITSVLTDFIHFIWHHPSVTSASPLDKSRVKYELKVYLLAHATQVSDNSRFGAQSIPSHKTISFNTPTSSYYQWVRTTSADHTSCPHAFAFVSCLLSKGGRDCFAGAEEKYVAEDLCRHLASMCRQYNDYGSLQRDRDDKNLNSVNFPEFTGTDREMKDELFRIADYERRGLEMAMGRLGELTARRREAARLMDAIGLFVDVTDVYGQIYVLRDIDGPVGV